jgi:two-component system, OmpR family, alkaline phosphatase synthesis response regulator PhoP
MSQLIVVIDDEEDLLELLEYSLSKEGFEVAGFLCTKNVEQVLDEEQVDLMIVDRNLPDIEGSVFVQKIREGGCDVPVLFLSAKVSEDDRLTGFERGGDDYMTKPFSMKELVARAKVIIKRANPSSVDKIIYRDITLNNSTKTVLVDKEEVSLTKLEFNLLKMFIVNKNRVLNRDELLSQVWGNDGEYQSKTVNVAIKRLKEKIDPLKDKEYIRSIRGEGYTLC